MGGIVVHHEVHVRPHRHLGVDPLEEIKKLGCTVPFVALADHHSCGDVERGKQGSRTVRILGMGAPFGCARCHGQDRLFAIQRLDLRLLVHAQHDRAVWWRHVEADDLLHLVDEQGIGG